MIKTRITEMFGIKYPIISAPMGPFYTTELAVAVSEAGGLGVLSHINMLDQDNIKAIKESVDYFIEHSDKPFGINIRTARLQLDSIPLAKKLVKWINENPRIQEQCVFGITSAGSPRKVSKLWKDSCPTIKHFHVAPALYLAQKVVDSGCDGLIVTGIEGGGHQSYEEITTLILIQEVVNKFPQLPLIASGGFASPEGLSMAIAGGADAIIMGTRFIATKQSEFHENYKSVLYPATDKDTLLTTGAFGPIRLLKNKYSIEHGKAFSKEEKVDFESSFDVKMMRENLEPYEYVYRGDVVNGAILAGQGVGLIDSEIDVEDIIVSFTKKTEELLKIAYSKIK